jgi:predicted DNA-binding protein
MKTAHTRKPAPASDPLLSFRLPAEDRERLEVMAAKLGAPISTAARIVVKRGLEQPPEILV